MNFVHQIAAVSQYGINRIKNEYPKFSNVSVSRLGVTDKGINPMNENEVFHIVSCSSFIPLKRVHLIIEILKHLPFQVKWTHFGDGPLRDEIHALAKELPENVQTDFKGFVANDAVIDFYKNEPIDLFMNVSELEGIPVSIMEAISFGIPSTGCQVCGVPEIVTKETGFLFEMKINIEDAVRQISIYKNMSKNEKLTFLKGVKIFWKKKFDADVNYSTFIAENLQ
jgi:glycosyltransferase involved in cell wall biosynthesis